MFKFRQRGLYFSPDGTGGTGASGAAGGSSGTSTGSAIGNGGQSGGSAGGQGGDAGNQAKDDLKFDSWIKDQPATVQTMIQEYEKGLKNTVAATRDERDNLQKQIKDLLPKAERGSELEKALLGMQTELDSATKRANFTEDAVKADIGCTNIKAAWALAVSEDLFDKRGNANWVAIKEMAPELFKKTVPEGDGGSGANRGNTGGQTMDDLIRSKMR